MSSVEINDSFSIEEGITKAVDDQLSLVMETFQNNYRHYFHIGHIHEVLSAIRAKVEPNYAHLSYSDRENCSFHP